MDRKSELTIGVSVRVEHEAPDGLPHAMADGEGVQALDLYGPRTKPGGKGTLGALEYVAVPRDSGVRAALKARKVGHANEP